MVETNIQEKLGSYKALLTLFIPKRSLAEQVCFVEKGFSTLKERVAAWCLVSCEEISWNSHVSNWKRKYLAKSELTSTGLNEIFSLSSLSTLIRRRSIEFISGINVNIDSKQLQQQNYDNDILNNYWFLQILKQCGSTIKTLTLRSLIITDEILIKYKGTLPCSESLNMSSCYDLTDKGLPQILQPCRSTLDIGRTDITGENLSEYK